MEQIYLYLGLVIFWIISTIGIVMLIGFLFKISIDKMSELGWIAWTIVDYARHREKFKIWLEEKGK